MTRAASKARKSGYSPMSGFKSSSRHARSNGTGPSTAMYYQEEGLEEEEEDGFGVDGMEDGGYDVDHEDYRNGYDNEDDGEDEEEDQEGEQNGIGRGGNGRHGHQKGKKDGAQVLPVADLPDDWEGEVQDGATYLALAAGRRANKSLPAYTRVANPWTGPTADFPTHTTTATRNAAAGPSRHPALPKEAWQAVFPLHFVAYKKRIAQNWPPSPSVPYPADWPTVPPTTKRGEWGYYINGYPRETLEGPSGSRPGRVYSPARPAETVDEEEAMNMEEDTANVLIEGKGEDEEVDMALDEESVGGAQGIIAGLEDGLEPFGERHKAREPHVSALQGLSTPMIITLLSTLTLHIQNALTPLEDDLIPPTYDPMALGSSRPHTRANPFTDRYSRWIFALLLVLDPFLSAEQISVLRELARVISRVGGWRWVEAVMGGEVGLPSGVRSEEGQESVPWVLGARWKYGRDSRGVTGIAENEMGIPAKEQIPPRGREEYDETGVDETLGRCWLIVHAIAAGWGQRDLIMDLEEMFS